MQTAFRGRPLPKASMSAAATSWLHPVNVTPNGRHAGQRQVLQSGRVWAVTKAAQKCQLWHGVLLPACL